MTGNTGRAGGRIVLGVGGTAASLTAVRWLSAGIGQRRVKAGLLTGDPGEPDYARAAVKELCRSVVRSGECLPGLMCSSGRA